MALEEYLEEYIKKQVVIDTKSPYLYIGTLTEVTDLFLTLTEVDVHDHSEYNSTKEIYILEALKYGVKVNRHKVKIFRHEIISISLLADVVEY